MFFSHIFSASLIFSFDLEDSAADVLTASQEAAAYLIMVSMCVFIAGFNISCGSVITAGIYLGLHWERRIIMPIHPTLAMHTLAI